MAVRGVLVLASVVVALVTGLEGQRLRRSDDVSALQVVVDGHSQQMAQMAAQLTAVQSQLNVLQNHVAFHARRSSDPFDVASHGTLVFDTAVTNVGNAYDPRSGIFTAPFTGTYMFFINCMAVDSSTEETYIMLQGNSVAGCFSSKPGGSTSEQGGTMVTVHVQQGQQVWVQLQQGAQDVRGTFWNTFSGFLLKSDA